MARRRVGLVDLFFVYASGKRSSSLGWRFRRRSARRPRAVFFCRQSVSEAHNTNLMFHLNLSTCFTFHRRPPHNGAGQSGLSRHLELARCLIWRTHSLSRCFAIRWSRSGTRLRPVDVTRTGEFRSRANPATTLWRDRLTRDEERARSTDAMRLC